MLLLLQQAAAEVNVTRLPHGLLEKTDYSYTCTALYHLVIAFGSPEVEHYENITSMIRNVSELVKQERFPGMGFTSVLLEQLNERYRALNQNMYMDNPGARTYGTVSAVSAPSGKMAANRNKRGMADFIGQLSSDLFGIATENDLLQIREVIEENRNELSIVSHRTNRMITVVNATRFQMMENRKVLNNLIETTSELMNWAKEVRLRQHMYHVLLFRINMIENLVRQLEHTKDKC